MGPSPPTRLRMHRCMALAVEPRPGGDTSRTMTAAGARQHSLQGRGWVGGLAGEGGSNTCHTAQLPWLLAVCAAD